MRYPIKYLIDLIISELSFMSKIWSNISINIPIIVVIIYTNKRFIEALVILLLKNNSVGPMIKSQPLRRVTLMVKDRLYPKRFV